MKKSKKYKTETQPEEITPEPESEAVTPETEPTAPEPAPEPEKKPEPVQDTREIEYEYYSKTRYTGKVSVSEKDAQNIAELVAKKEHRAAAEYIDRITNAQGEETITECKFYKVN